MKHNDDIVFPNNFKRQLFKELCLGLSVFKRADRNNILNKNICTLLNVYFVKMQSKRMAGILQSNNIIDRSSRLYSTFNLLFTLPSLFGQAIKEKTIVNYFTCINMYRIFEVK